MKPRTHKNVQLLYKRDALLLSKKKQQQQEVVGKVQERKEVSRPLIVGSYYSEAFQILANVLMQHSKK